MYNHVEVGSADPRGFSLVARASGAPITAGTVNYYLLALNGANAGQWWRDSDQTWQNAETANPMTHRADGHWTRTLAASPWADGIAYLEYAKESGDLHIPVSRHLRGKPAVALQVLLQDWTAITAAVPAYCLLQAARFLRNVWYVAAGVLRVRNEANTADSWSRPVQSDAGAAPITGVGE